MAELAEDRPKVPKPPNRLHLLACALEAAIVAAFIGHRSILGLLLCLAYGWFSATWALVFRGDE
jgi:hypothetical protein